MSRPRAPVLATRWMPSRSFSPVMAGNSRPRPGRVLLCALLLVVAPVAPARDPLTFGSIETTTPDGPLRGWWAKIRLDDPRVRLDSTAPLGTPMPDVPDAEATLQTVPDWAEAQGATLALNANFFGLVRDPKKASPGYKPGYRAGEPSNILGLSLSSRGLTSPPRLVAAHGDPALLIYADGRARVTYVAADDLAGVVCAVAGIGATDDQKNPGSLLVEAGQNTGATARVAPKVRHPRTAAGVAADGRTLILLAIDGRQPGHSVGATLPEMADMLLELGTHDAVALDGGGSTSFYLKRSDGTVVTNKPSGGQWRPIANHLGIWIAPAAAKRSAAAEPEHKP
ncbi:MAG: hypothetical protein C0518_12665 [Opitutus sp.]|nr:hypothetical protein [Opitutus sp.]